MRLGTWNCQTGLAANWEAIEALNADVLAIQECEPGIRAQVESHDGWACEFQPGRWHKGLAVLARSPYEIEAREPAEPFCISTAISGPARFRFVGFWAMTEKDVGYTYTRQATRVIDQLPDDGVPTVLAGDFNASKSQGHLRNVQRLAARGLVSAYHAHHCVDHSAVEADPTSYYLWQESRRYHMDFVFVPAEWRIHAVEVGGFKDYSRPGGMSDHVPIVVDVSEEAIAHG